MAIDLKSFFRPDRVFYSLTAIAVLAVVLSVGGIRVDAEEGRRVPPPAVDETAPQGAQLETAVFAGGCFWGVQGVFQHVAGVTNAVSGYTGGDQQDALYQVVGTGTTGHAESVQVKFDPQKVSYGKLLQIYFSVAHDPTELNRQGPDSGTQYRSTIFPMTAEQAKVAKAYIAQLDGAHVFSDPIVTTVEPDRTFYAAENYHQNFLTLNPNYPYIVINDLPKVANLKRLFPESYRVEPVLVSLAKASN
ncbi:peptide-methionine (S)-S-oxide reductase MsrA [Hyphomicrobium sp.]|jgi:peptide-methionine (S)-S-oxide reductase|uniref:peptide-methionine (S)-S-oxide reductase MsrA n=1 Tax=Hyphomicrobium sp. TaxID=82 RepID=UPI0035639302